MFDALRQFAGMANATPVHTLTGEELTLVINALARSSAAFEQTETLSGQAVRAARETKLADKLRRSIARSL